MDDLSVRYLSDAELITARRGGTLEPYAARRTGLPPRRGRGVRLDQPAVVDLVEEISAEPHPTKLDMNRHCANTQIVRHLVGVPGGGGDLSDLAFFRGAVLGERLAVR